MITKRCMSANVIKILEQHNIKPSVQRISILGYLMEHHTHPTVDEIYTALAPAIPTLSKTTVYNTLKILTGHGAALTLTIDDKYTCYDACTHPHAHFLCKSCGKVYDVMQQQDAMYSKDVCIEGFEVQEVHHYYKGICKQCLNHKKGLLKNKTK